MSTPVSTYRLQANCNFTLQDIQGIIDYLNQLGISTLYCAPFFQSRSGSNHGYDVINPYLINPELGTIDEVRQIASVLKNNNMNWLQDIVPNHMSYHYKNIWLRDIFEKGIHSDYFNYFDIDWNYWDQRINGKVLLPFLGEELNAFIDQKKINVSLSKEGFLVNFYDTNYPLVWSSYYTILSQGQESNPNHSNSFNKYIEIVNQWKEISGHYTDAVKVHETIRLKEQLFQLYSTDEDIRIAIAQSLQRINNDAEALHRVLDQQLFLPVHYSQTDKEINYRRFFVINDLICLRMESPEVFTRYHQFLKTLLEEDLIQGLRVDHIDGLADPEAYLNDLRKLAGDDCYIIVEKILEEKEKLPAHWPIEGTSGYEFLSCINHLFTQPEHEQKMTAIYHQFIGSVPDYEEMVFEKKSHILLNKMNGELDNLIALFLHIDPSQLKQDLKEALAILLASFHVYRPYVNQLPMQEEDYIVITEAFERAEGRSPELSEQFQFMRSVLLMEPNGSQQEEKLKLLVRLQQFTGPLAAKGVEDTVFYIYNRLISHNEVGDSPYRFGISVEEFHHAMKQRLLYMPRSINATATHDTKRGEDARMRMNSLSEIPEAWAAMVVKWKTINRSHKQNHKGIEAPSENDEYFIYQSLLGGFPMNGVMDDSFLQRFKEATIKAMREAKVNSDWDHPNENYENATLDFIDSMVKDKPFIDSFLSLFSIVKQHGMMLSLAQTLVKVTAPGIPDTFQGSELWDLNFVDPDNRRVIDFGLRKEMLLDCANRSEKDPIAFLKYLLDNAANGQIKLYTLWKSLNERRLKPSLFESGDYMPLAFSGRHSHRVIGYARHLNGQWSVTITPKEVKTLGGGNRFPLAEVWEDTVVILPSQAPDHWQNSFTNELYKAHHYTLEDKQPEDSDAPIDAAFSNEILIGKRLELRHVLKQFPIALLENRYE